MRLLHIYELELTIAPRIKAKITKYIVSAITHDIFDKSLLLLLIILKGISYFRTIFTPDSTHDCSRK